MKTLIKNTLPKNSLVYKFIRNIYQYRYWHPKEWENDIIADYAAYKGKVNFIQVGSSNGVSADPINKIIMSHDWHGILVEPVKYIFEELKKNYSLIKDRLIFENSAISNTNGKLKFYRLKKSENPNLPYWYEQLGSFNKEVVIKHKDAIPGFDELFFEDSVNAITFKDLISKHNIKKVDFIEIDTEGYDFEILKMIPFSDLKVDFIMFENRHLSDRDYRKALRLLKDNGFVLGSKYKDTIAVSKEILPFILSIDHMEESNISRTKNENNSKQGKNQEYTYHLSAKPPRTLH